MGLHKLVYTAARSSMSGFNDEDRRAARRIIATEQARLAFEKEVKAIQDCAGESVISQAYLQVGYVGNLPKEAGNYLVLDPTTNGTQYVVLTDRMTCCGMPLERFNMKSYRWFLLPKLSAGDFEDLP